MLEIDMLFNLSIKDCMFITSSTKNFDGCLDLVVIGRTNGFKEVLALLVMAGHPHHSPLLPLHSNLNPNGFPYPFQIHQLNHVILCINKFLSYQLHIFFNRHFFTCKIQRGNETCRLFLLFTISHVHDPWQNQHSNLPVKSRTSSNCLLWFGDSSLSTLESTT